jgi:hypothetical protein
VKTRRMTAERRFKICGAQCSHGWQEPVLCETSKVGTDKMASNPTSNIPPVVIPASGNNIIISPLQVCLGAPFEETQLRLQTAREPRLGMYQKCWEGVWGHYSRLSSWTNNRSSFLEVRLHQNPSVRGLLKFYSLKYHRLHPEYIHTRVEKLGLSYNLRILLILCDIVRNYLQLSRCLIRFTLQSEHREPVRELTKVKLTFYTAEFADNQLGVFNQQHHYYGGFLVGPVLLMP